MPLQHLEGAHSQSGDASQGASDDARATAQKLEQLWADLTIVVSSGQLASQSLLMLKEPCCEWASSIIQGVGMVVKGVAERRAPQGQRQCKRPARHARKP